jgi:hypothetical protein
MQSPTSGYYAYNWFYNNTVGSPWKQIAWFKFPLNNYKKYPSSRDNWRVFFYLNKKI